jgi:hypothetical protein
MKNSTENNSELMEITFLLNHPQSGNSPGTFCRMERKYASKLIELGYARPTKEEDKVKPIPQKYTEVIFIKPHHRYAYSAGDIGTIRSEDAEDMENLGYVELIENEN